MIKRKQIMETQKEILMLYISTIHCKISTTIEKIKKYNIPGNLEILYTLTQQYHHQYFEEILKIGEYLKKHKNLTIDDIIANDDLFDEIHAKARKNISIEKLEI